jgi:hypothetical protein
MVGARRLGRASPHITQARSSVQLKSRYGRKSKVNARCRMQGQVGGRIGVEKGRAESLAHKDWTLSVMMGLAREVRFAMLAGEIRANAGIPCSSTFRGRRHVGELLLSLGHLDRLPAD